MKKILLGLVVCAGFCACSNDDVVLSNPATSAIDGDGYISLAINLPTTGSTRANDVYDDGIAAEYNVNDATLYLFGGASEATATLYQSYSLTGDWNEYTPNNDNITVKQQVSQKITRPANGDLYVLVVLNGSGLTNTFVTGATLSDLQQTLATMDVATIASVGGDGNFYMTNAPLWHGTSDGYVVPTGEVQTLVHIDSSKIYDTQAEAEANAATEIYVERGVAKVTVNGTSVQSGIEGVTVSVDGFVLDLTNLQGYPVRNTTNTQTWWEYASANTAVVGGAYRMVGGVAVGAEIYRTYWAVDGNYSTTLYTEGTSGNRVYPETVNSLGGTIPATLTAADGVTGAYCLENTMDVEHMNQDETTRAIVAVTLTVPGADEDGSFYTFEGDKSTLYNKTSICNEVLALFAANGDVENAIENYWIGGELVFSNYYSASIDTSKGATDATVSITAGKETFSAEQFKDGEIPAVLDPDDTTGAFAAVVAQINADNEFSYYAGGVAYYPVLIKHFGDDLTPWDIQDVTGESYPDGTYGTSDTAEQDWLGRYGVLRNNWYDINVTAVNQIGSADVPTAYGEPDDPIESWISLEINILSWAKRTQGVTL